MCLSLYFLQAFESEMQNQTRSVSKALPPPGGKRKVKKTGPEAEVPVGSVTEISKFKNVYCFNINNDVAYQNCSNIY